MIVGPDRLLAELGRYAESGRPPTTRDTFVEVLAEAAQLRGADPRSEPAALLFAAFVEHLRPTGAREIAPPKRPR